MHNPFLIGERIYLRAPQHSDAPLVATYFNDSEVNRQLNHHRPISPERQATRLEDITKSDEHILFAIVRHDDKLIGLAGLHELNFRNRSAELGICIGEKSDQGKGLGTEATKLIVNYAFQTLNLHRVELDVREDNTRAIRAYEKSGFVREGVKRQAYWGEGRWNDVVLMSALNPHH